MGLRRLDELDVFFLANALLFVVMCVVAYHDRWVAYMGAGRSIEFLLCAGAILVSLGMLRAFVRLARVPALLLVFVQLGILVHFAGGFVYFGGARLYDHVFAGLRYDKYVHAANAFVAGLATLHVCRRVGLPSGRFLCILVFLSVLGLGAVVEVAEFVVTRTVAQHGVGGYEDTALDLISNAVGGLAYLLVGAAVLDRIERISTERTRRGVQ